MHYLLISFVLLLSQVAFAEGDLLKDFNGDGQVSIASFGDSITYGVGDGVDVGEFIEISPVTDGAQGFHRRLEERFSLPVYNKGVPGDALLHGSALSRFPNILNLGNFDLITIMEGANDAIFLAGTDDYARALQQLINMSLAREVKPILLTIPLPCCNRVGQSLFIAEYNRVIRERADLNDIPLADVSKAWTNTCVNKEECELFNIPDGVHPNTKGYDLFFYVIAATLLGIDIHEAGGAANLESALGLAAGSVFVKPEVVATEGGIK